MGIAATALTKLYNIIDGVSSNYYTYTRHNVAKLQLPAVTIQARDNIPVLPEAGQGYGGRLERHSILFSIRAHTAYFGGIRNSAQASAILEDVLDDLKISLNLDDGYFIYSFNSEDYDGDFSESASMGAVYNQS
jgi:hypothetical protein